MGTQVTQLARKKVGAALRGLMDLNIDGNLNWANKFSLRKSMYKKGFFCPGRVGTYHWYVVGSQYT